MKFYTDIQNLTFKYYLKSGEILMIKRYFLKKGRKALYSVWSQFYYIK